MTVEEYTHALADEWDALVEASRNGTFLHKRGYMDYHASRFADASLIARDGRGRAVAALPAHYSGDVVSSHRGLTYGGWLMTMRADAAAMLDIWAQAAEHYRARGFSELFYRPAPHIYHKYPAEEDIYAVFRAGGRLDSTLISSVIATANAPRFDETRRQGVRKASAAGVVVDESGDWVGFWAILTALLAEKYNATPVHSLDEITMLQGRFPANIKLYTATFEDRIIGGAVLYITDTVAHTQYVATTDAGRELNALPLLYSYLLEQYRHLPYFDFGTSNEDAGRILNTGLIAQKQAYGARAIVYPSFTIPL